MVAARVWTLLDGTRTIDRIVDELCRELDVTSESARSDVIELLETLESASLVRRA